MRRRPGLRFAALYFLMLLPVGLQTPYLFLFFQRRGLSDSQLGTLASVSPMVTLLVPPLWGMIADRLGDRRRLLALLLASSAVVFPCIIGVTSFLGTLVLMTLFSAFSMPPNALADAITLEHVEKTGEDYGRMRLWGSVGFAAPLLAMGLVLKPTSAGSPQALYPIFVGYAIFRLLAAGWSWMLPESSGPAAGRLDLRAARAFASPRFLCLALCALIGWGAMSSYYLYFSIYLDRIGVADNAKGYFWAIAVAAEIVMMFCVGGLIRRIGVKWTFTIGIAGVALRLFAYSLLHQPLYVAPVQCLHALTFAAFSVSSITFVSRLVPPELRASGQTLWMALTSGLGAALGSKLAGAAVSALGLASMYRLFGAAAALAMVIAVLGVREPPAR
jgi:PPP family 3-phenylpropionic acid transporter